VYKRQVKEEWGTLEDEVFESVFHDEMSQDEAIDVIMKTKYRSKYYPGMYPKHFED